MTLTELRYVVAVARERHFGRAAESCFVSQPTLSVGVQKLEDELGVQLFERSRGEVIVTPCGEAVVARAEAVLAAIGDIRDTAAAFNDPLGGRLTLGLIYTIGPFLVPRLIGALKQRAPDLSLVVRENYTDVLARQLKSGDIDLAIMSLPFSDPQLEHRNLYEEPFKIALPAMHPLARNKRIRAAALAEESMLLLGSRNCFRDQVVEACPACAGEARAASGIERTLEGTSLGTICQMVAAGAGVTVLPQTMHISEELDDHLAIRGFASPVPKRTVAVFYRKAFARPALIDCIERCVRDADLAGVRYVGRSRAATDSASG